MSKYSELNPFQKEFNSLTFYLFLLNSKCKHLEKYDYDGDFINHIEFFNKCRKKLQNIIQDDKELLINQPFFIKYKDIITKTKEEKKKTKEEKKKTKEERKKTKEERKKTKKERKKIKQEEENYIYNTYFEYSDTLSINKIKKQAHELIKGSIAKILCWILSVGFILLMSIFLWPKGIRSFVLYCFILFLILARFMFLFRQLFRGIILRYELTNKEITKRKFKYLYSDDYCYGRIKDAEAFFKSKFNIDYEFREFSKIEKQFPEENNFFYNTIIKVKFTGKKAKENKDNLLRINKNIYCRAVFSEILEVIKKHGKIIGTQKDIAYAFFYCLSKVNLSAGNIGFVECINLLIDPKHKTIVDTSFNPYKQKFEKDLNILNTSKKTLIKDTYMDIIKKYDYILENIHITNI